MTGIEHTRVRDGGQNTGEHHEAQLQIDRPAQPHVHAPAEGAAPLTLAAALAPVAALLCSVALLLMGNGLQGTLIPVRANLESFSAPRTSSASPPAACTVQPWYAAPVTFAPTSR